MNDIDPFNNMLLNTYINYKYYDIALNVIQEMRQINYDLYNDYNQNYLKPKLDKYLNKIKSKVSTIPKLANINIKVFIKDLTFISYIMNRIVDLTELILDISSDSISPSLLVLKAFQIGFDIITIFLSKKTLTDKENEINKICDKAFEYLNSEYNKIKNNF